MRQNETKTPIFDYDLCEEDYEIAVDNITQCIFDFSFRLSCIINKHQSTFVVSPLCHVYIHLFNRAEVFDSLTKSYDRTVSPVRVFAD